MIFFTLKRVATGIHGTFGVLLDAQGLPFAVTLELPWLENRANVSCIPDGVYICQRVQSPKFGETFEITNVKDRTDILLHKANTVDDLLGCIGVAESFDLIGAVPGVAASGHGYAEFMGKMTGRQTCQVMIKWA